MVLANGWSWRRWVYLFFFNTLWVWFPLYMLYEAYAHIVDAFGIAERVEARKKKS